MPILADECRVWRHAKTMRIAGGNRRYLWHDPWHLRTHLLRGNFEMKKDTFRVVTRGADGQLHIRDYDKESSVKRLHTQIGVDDCSTDLDLRGMPVFRGLIGPIPEGKNIVRYESPEVFETLTKDWGAETKPPRRRRSRT